MKKFFQDMILSIVAGSLVVTILAIAAEII